MNRKIHSCNREAVAMLACAALDARETDRTRQHLQRCPACREYFRQLSDVCAVQKSAAQQLPDAEVSPRLHSRIRVALEARSRSRWEELAAVLTARWAPIAGVATLLAVLALTFPRRPSPIAQLAKPSAPSSPVRAVTASAEPKLIAYRLALNRSPEEFDRLLTHESAHSSFTTPLRAGLMRLESEL